VGREKSGFYPLEPWYAIEVPVEAHNGIELELLHQHGVVGISEWQIEIDVQIEDLAKAPLARKHDPRQFKLAEAVPRESWTWAGGSCAAA
jgi:hypothetical protein